MIDHTGLKRLSKSLINTYDYETAKKIVLAVAVTIWINIMLVIIEAWGRTLSYGSTPIIAINSVLFVITILAVTWLTIVSVLSIKSDLIELNGLKEVTNQNDIQ